MNGRSGATTTTKTGTIQTTGTKKGGPPDDNVGSHNDIGGGDRLMERGTVGEFRLLGRGEGRKRRRAAILAESALLMGKRPKRGMVDAWRVRFLRGAPSGLPYPISGASAAEIERALRGRGWGHAGDVKTIADESQAVARRASLLFGEILPAGVTKVLDDDHLNARRATTLVDLGAGMGKLALQAFLEWPSLAIVYGIELCQSRHAEARTFLGDLAMTNPDAINLSHDADDAVQLDLHLPSSDERKENEGDGSDETWRTLRLEHGDMFAPAAVARATAADIVVCQTDVPAGRRPDLVALLAALRPGTRFLLYLALPDLPGVLPAGANGLYCAAGAGFRQIAPHDSHFATSWARAAGHRLGCWLRVPM